MKRHQGITLIELMIVVAIISILASVVFPLYNDQIRKSKRYTAQSAMAARAVQLDRVLASQPNVGYGLTNADVDQTDALIFSDTLRTYYDFKIKRETSDDDYTYLITAIPQSGQANDTCGTLTINHAGVKTHSEGTNCWK